MGQLIIKNRYSTVPNHIICDKNLSFKARGIWAYLQSKPDGWNFAAKRICEDSQDGYEAVLSGLKELEGCGYLKRVKRHNGLGHWEVDYVLSENPKPDNPETGNPLQGNPLPANPETANPTNNKESNTNKELNKKECTRKSAKSVGHPPASPISYSDFLRENEKFDERKPNIPTKQQVLEYFVKSGGTMEMAKKFFENNQATGWNYRGSPIKRFEPLANGFIASWNELESKSKPKKAPINVPTYKDI